MRLKSGETKDIVWKALFEIVEARNDGKFTMKELMAQIHKKHPEFTYRKAYMAAHHSLLKHGMVKDTGEVKNRKEGFVYKILQSGRIALTAHCTGSNKVKGRQKPPVTTEQDLIVRSIDDLAKHLPGNAVISLELLGAMFMEHIEGLKKKAIRYDTDMAQQKERQQKQADIIRGLQDEVEKLDKKMKEAVNAAKGKVAGGRYKELLDENKRLKERLDEQNREIQRLNKASSNKGFSLGETARFRGRLP